MHRLSANGCRSCAFVHNAVSCAFTLRHLGTAAGGGEHAGLVGRLIGLLEREGRMSEWEDADRSFRSSSVCGGGVPLSAWDLPWPKTVGGSALADLGGFPFCVV